jgi:high-affinity nickel permease
LPCLATILASSTLASAALTNSSPVSLIAVLSLGFFLGMRHATDADHVVAVSTIVAREKRLRGATLIGALWGIGHTITILAVGIGIILFTLVIPPRLGLSMEFSVGLMLILLGALNLTGFNRQIQQQTEPFSQPHSHSQEAEPHTHARSDAALAYVDHKFGQWSLYQWARPLVVGLVHGLAGSAAVALLVLTTLHDSHWAVAYLFLFGVGTIAGMMLITFGMASALHYAGHRWDWLNRRLAVATGILSLAFGLFIVYQMGFVHGLFTTHPTWTPE